MQVAGGQNAAQTDIGRLGRSGERIGDMRQVLRREDLRIVFLDHLRAQGPSAKVSIVEQSCRRSARRG